MEGSTTKAEVLKKVILSQYKSVRQFAVEMDIPYSTLVTCPGERDRGNGLQHSDPYLRCTFFESG